MTNAPEDGMAGFVLALVKDVADRRAEHDQRRALVRDYVRLDRADGRPWCCECPWCIARGERLEVGTCGCGRTYWRVSGAGVRHCGRACWYRRAA